MSAIEQRMVGLVGIRPGSDTSRRARVERLAAEEIVDVVHETPGLELRRRLL